MLLWKRMNACCRSTCVHAAPAWRGLRRNRCHI